MIYQTKSTEFWRFFPNFFEKLNFGKKNHQEIQILDLIQSDFVTKVNFFIFLSEI
jgi:hypothetical protein